MKTHNNSYGVWYGPDQISSLIKRYAPNVNVLMSASVLLGLGRQLDQIGQNGQYFIPLNINCLSQNFEDGSKNDLQNNHWAGLYVIKDTNHTTAIYFDPMGKPINSELASQIKDKLATDSIGQPLLNNPIQYVKDKGIELSGNIDDCGPMLVYCVVSLANNKNMRQSVKSLEQSISFGQFLRESFDKHVGFDEIYQKTLQLFQGSASVIQKVPSSKVIPSSDTENIDPFVENMLKAAEVGGSYAAKAIDKIRKMGESSLPTKKGVKIINKSVAKNEAGNEAPVIDKTEASETFPAGYLANIPPPSFERIMEAIKCGDQKCAKELINKIDNNSLGELSRTDVTSEPLLHMAISAGYEEVAKALLDKQPSLAKIVDENGNTALHLAAAHGMKEACMLVLSKMSLGMVTATNKDSNTAQDLATKVAGNQELAKLILIHIIQEKIEEGNELINGSNEEAILLIGSTRAGKSTLVNYLTMMWYLMSRQIF